MRKVLMIVSAPVIIGLLAILFGGPATPKPVDAFNSPFRKLDYATLPAVQSYTASDSSTLHYRDYAPNGQVTAAEQIRGSVVLIHGSAADGQSMHAIATAFSQAGYRAFTLDMRGHGATTRKGQIDYIGQLEDDVAAFAESVAIPQPATLVGFSLGGGFVLRFAASKHAAKFQSYLLLAPFLGQDAPTQRADDNGWVSVGVPRIIALKLLNAMGVSAFNNLIVARYALSDEARQQLTPEYSYALSTNFRPWPDYLSNIKQVTHPCAMVIGEHDELFHADQFARVISDAGKDWPVSALTNTGHIDLVVSGSAHLQAIEQVRKLQTLR